MSDPEQQKKIVTDRLEEAGLPTNRFIQCQPGEKESHDHSQGSIASVSGNYGIYANGNDQLVILDVDDYDELEDKSGLKALLDLSSTFEQGSPHDGTHKLYKVEPTDDGELVARVLEDVFGKNNPTPSWGEVRAKNQYVVGAGSQLEGCDKEWCDNCADPDGGRYTIKSDEPIATIATEALIGALREDPALSTQASDEEHDADEGEEGREDGDSSGNEGFDVDERLEFAREHDDKLDRLMRGNHSDYGGDRSEAECALAYKLAFWLEGDNQAVEQVLEHDASTPKWDERTDDAYRDSVLEAVDEQSEYFDPDAGGSPDPPSELDWSEVERANAILDAEVAVDSAVGDLTVGNGGYGIPWNYTDEDGEVTRRGIDHVTNFTLEALSVLNTDGGKEFVLRVHPNHPKGEPYDVRVEPAVFNSSESFRSEIVTAPTTWFDPSNRENVPTVSILRYLRETVGSQPAPRREGTPHIGLSEDAEEYVTPEGSITTDGWAEDPRYQFYTQGGEDDGAGALPQKWRITPEEHPDVDEESVANICKLLPQIRDPERGLPILGWFYAAALKPYVHEWADEFPLLSPHGDTGTGKTSAIRTFMKAFGGNGEPFSASDTSFTIEKHLAESRGFPVWLDEYKPTEMQDTRKKRLHRRLKQVTKEGTLAKGRPDLSEVTLHLRAPVILSGEQKVDDPAVRRRAVITNLTQQATRDGTETKAAFGELTGTSYEDKDGTLQYPDGYDLSLHARAFYQWALTHSDHDLFQVWRTAHEKVKTILERIDVTVGGSEQYGLQTVVFGIILYRKFATDHGAEADELVTDAEIRDACIHIVENIGKDGQRREHADEFLELMTLAATDGYLESGIHHRVYDPNKFGSEVLAVHLPSTYSAVKKYVRESNLEAEYSVLSKTDYDKSFSNKEDDPTAYVLATSHKTRKIENGNRTVVFDHEAVAEKLGQDFNITAFRPGPEEHEFTEEGADADGAVTALSDVSAKMREVSVEAAAVSVLEPKPWLQDEGTLEADGTRINYEARGRSNPAEDVEQGETYRVESAQVETDKNGCVYLELRDGVTEVSRVGETKQTGIQSGEEADDEAVADGGGDTGGKEQFDQLEPRVVQQLREGFKRDDTVTPAQVAGAIGESPEDVENILDHMASKDRVVRRAPETEGGFKMN
jgi:hypothetical protein